MTRKLYLVFIAATLTVIGVLVSMKLEQTVNTQETYRVGNVSSIIDRNDTEANDIAIELPESVIPVEIETPQYLTTYNVVDNSTTELVEVVETPKVENNYQPEEVKILPIEVDETIEITPLPAPTLVDEDDFTEIVEDPNGNGGYHPIMEECEGGALVLNIGGVCTDTTGQYSRRIPSDSDQSYKYNRGPDQGQNDV